MSSDYSGGASDSHWGRRPFLRLVGAAGAVGGLVSVASAPAAGALAQATVSIDPAAASEWAVDDRIFGKFIEHNGRDAYPGIYADHLANGSFEVWNTVEAEDRTAVLYRDTETYDDIAYPWEPVASTERVTFSHEVGGIHGRTAEPDLDSGEGVPASKRPQPAGVSEPRYQHIDIKGTGKDGGRGGVSQRVALPDHRTLEYEVRFVVRGQLQPTDECEVRLEAPDGRPLASGSVPLTNDWTSHEVHLTLAERSGSQYLGSPFGEYVLAFVGEGRGRFDLDWAMLVDGDAVAGKFNPTTIDLLREFNVTSLRWPGGNFASQYHWRDGVGPLEDRPVVPNANWGGLERNYLGTNEFLEFCDLAGVEPHLTVGFWSEISPTEAADWVEYVNGDSSTEMGGLRAEHGYSEPWNVRSWQVGNEVWLPGQIGNTDSVDYATRYVEYYEAMRAVDPSIEVGAVGIDPMYTDFHDGSGVRNVGTPPVWNRELFDTAGTAVEGVDVHRYTRGIVNDDLREEWLDTNDTDPVGYNEVLVNFPKQFDQLMAELDAEAADRGIADLRIDVGEWNLQPRVSPGWPRAGYSTMAHASYVAGTFNTFIRRGDAVKLGHQRDNSLFWRAYPIDFRPVPPGDYVNRTFAEPFAGSDHAWHHVPATVDGPTLTIPETGLRIREMTDVQFVDAAALRSQSGTGEDLVVFLTNGSLTESFTTAVDVAGWPAESADTVEAVLQVSADGDPFTPQTSWDFLNGFRLETQTLQPTAEGTVEVTLPPAAVARLTLSLS